MTSRVGNQTGSELFIRVRMNPAGPRRVLTPAGSRCMLTDRLSGAEAVRLREDAGMPPCSVMNCGILQVQRPHKGSVQRFVFLLLSKVVSLWVMMKKKKILG